MGRSLLPTFYRNCLPLKFLQAFFLLLLNLITNELPCTFTIATAAAIFTSLKTVWWFLPFRYVAKMASIQTKKCPASHTQLFDRYECTGYS